MIYEIKRWLWEQMLVIAHFFRAFFCKKYEWIGCNGCRETGRECGWYRCPRRQESLRKRIKKMKIDLCDTCEKSAYCATAWCNEEEPITECDNYKAEEKETEEEDVKPTR